MADRMLAILKAHDGIMSYGNFYANFDDREIYSEVFVYTEEILEQRNLIVEDGSLVKLTEEGVKAADLGFNKYFERKDKDVRLDRNAKRATIANAWWGICGTILGWCLRWMYDYFTS